MRPAIVFPDVEMVVTTYLRQALAAHGFPGVFVSNRRGTEDLAVWVRADGGTAINEVMERATVGVNVYAKSPTDELVSRLARTVAALLRAMPDGKPVCRVDEVLAPSPVADPLPRRYSSFSLVVRGVQLF